MTTAATTFNGSLRCSNPDRLVATAKPHFSSPPFSAYVYPSRSLSFTLSCSLSLSLFIPPPGELVVTQTDSQMHTNRHVQERRRKNSVTFPTESGTLESNFLLHWSSNAQVSLPDFFFCFTKHSTLDSQHGIWKNNYVQRVQNGIKLHQPSVPKKVLLPSKNRCYP